MPDPMIVGSQRWSLRFFGGRGVGNTNCFEDVRVLGTFASLQSFFPFRLTGNKGGSSSMEESAGIIVSNTSSSHK